MRFILDYDLTYLFTEPHFGVSRSNVEDSRCMSSTFKRLISGKASLCMYIYFTYSDLIFLDIRGSFFSLI